MLPKACRPSGRTLNPVGDRTAGGLGDIGGLAGPVGFDAADRLGGGPADGAGVLAAQVDGDGLGGDVDSGSSVEDLLEKAVSDDRRHELLSRVLGIAQDAALRDKRRALGRALAAGGTWLASSVSVPPEGEKRRELLRTRER
jgi:hypothetical protein